MRLGRWTKGALGGLVFLMVCLGVGSEVPSAHAGEVDTMQELREKGWKILYNNNFSKKAKKYYGEIVSLPVPIPLKHSIIEKMYNSEEYKDFISQLIPKSALDGILTKDNDELFSLGYLIVEKNKTKYSVLMLSANTLKKSGKTETYFGILKISQEDFQRFKEMYEKNKPGN